MAERAAFGRFGVTFSLQTMLLVVSLVGVALAVVHTHSEWIGALCASVFLALECIAMVGVICRQRERRVFWLAFLVFGYAFNWCAFHRDRETSYFPVSILAMTRTPAEYSPFGPAYLADCVFDATEFRPKVGDEVSAKYQNQNYYSATLKEIGEDGRYFVAWTDGTAPSWVAPQQISTFNIQGRFSAQYVTAILVAFLGAWLCRAIFGKEAGVA